ncbi:MAG: hypothetical protein MUC58_09755 [Rhizobiaceae bacterium]|jgi:hypothetical protein|nr:hypothetical protein [Rhizobiaceae bacterium]
MFRTSFRASNSSKASTAPAVGSILFATAMAAIGISVSAVPASAQDIRCTGLVGAISVDTVTVPLGARCVLRGTRVGGDVIVERGGIARVERGLIMGNIKGDGARSLVVTANTRLAGSVEWKLSGPVSVSNSMIDGDLKFEEGIGAVSAINNDIQGDIQAEKNLRGVLVSQNVIQGNLKCQESRPAPTGSGNIVAGNKEGQCRGL